MRRRRSAGTGLSSSMRLSPEHVLTQPPVSKYLPHAPHISKRLFSQQFHAAANTLIFLEANPHHPGLNLERIVNDPTAWSARVDNRYRISFDLDKLLDSGAPDWSGNITLLLILSHDDLYKRPR